MLPQFPSADAPQNRDGCQQDGRQLPGGDDHFPAAHPAAYHRRSASRKHFPPGKVVKAESFQDNGHDPVFDFPVIVQMDFHRTDDIRNVCFAGIVEQAGQDKAIRPATSRLLRHS